MSDPAEIRLNLSLREYLEIEFAHERALTSQKFEQAREALTLQRSIDEKHGSILALEVSRRLSELNHAHETAVKEQARTLPREMFDQWRAEHDKWRDIVNRELTAMTTRSMTWTAALGIAFIIVQIALSFWKRGGP